MAGETPPERIFLIGPRGSGKSTVAVLLARALGWQWADADAELERRAGRAIREVFADEGEAGFRRREAEVLHDLAGLPRYVVATGGGAVLRPDNRELLRAGGYVVWLDADADTLWGRIRGDATTAGRRPVLTVGGREEVEELLRRREPLYRECAHQVVWAAGRAADELAREAAAGWRRVGEGPSSR